MEKQLVQKQLITPEKSFKQELNKLLLSIDLPKFHNKKGNRQFTTKQKLAIVILYFRSQKSLRDFCEEFKETKWKVWLELDFLPKKSSVNNWIKLFDLDFIKSLIEKTNKGNGKNLAIDGTGIETDFKSKYFQKRLNDFGKKPKSNYHKLDVLIDIDTNKVKDFIFSMKQRHDIFVGKKILKRVKFKDKLILGDKGYDCEDLHKICKSKNNKLIVPTRKNSFKQRHNKFSLRNKLAKNFPEDLYRLRNNVESFFSSFKRKTLFKIKSKKCFTKRREMSFKILIHNLNCNLSLWFNFLFFKFKLKI